jgi:hypothetical protein
MLTKVNDAPLHCFDANGKHRRLMLDSSTGAVLGFGAEHRRCRQQDGQLDKDKRNNPGDVHNFLRK